VFVFVLPSVKSVMVSTNTVFTTDLLNELITNGNLVLE
jgi:CRISPR/Cas system-associated endonuclease Cas1